MGETTLRAHLGDAVALPERAEVGRTTQMASVATLSFAAMAVVFRLAGYGTLADLLLSIGGMIGAALFFIALLHWQRPAGVGLLDSSEVWVGISATLVLAGAAHLFARHWDGPSTGLVAVAQVAQLLVWGELVTVLGTCFTVAAMLAPYRDLRLRVCTLCAVLMVSVETLVIPADGTFWPWRPLGGVLVAVVGGGVMKVLGDSEAPAPVAVSRTGLGAVPNLVFALVVLVAQVVLDLPSVLTATLAGLGGLLLCVLVLRVVQDLSVLAAARAEARTDELTGLANRRALTTALDDALAAPGDVSLLVVDLDRFKAINDRFGHHVGDELLQHVTALFSEAVPRGALLARLGGDEFAVLLAGRGHEDAVGVARALAAAAAPVSDVRGRMLQVGASVGVATGCGTRLDGVELMRRADAAMYLAKGQRTGVRAYDADIDADDRERLRLAEELHEALSDPWAGGQIVVHFQPQVETATGRTVGAEALVRWKHPRLGLLAPDRFIELAEVNGLMARLTTHVLGLALAEAEVWRAMGRPLRVSVNLSPSCLQHADLLPALDDLLAAGLDPSGLVLEITETTIMRDPEGAIRATEAITGRGFGLSIDDYGTGYSSLAYLDGLPATELKLDRSFTAKLAPGSRTEAIVGATVELGHRLGLRLVAEGVEDPVTLALLRDLGCDETQGYLHSRPLAPADFRDWLLRASPATGATPTRLGDPAVGLQRR